jgi:hypothetical protein
MHLRITTAGTKIATIVAFYVGGVFLGLALGVAVGAGAGYAAAIGFSLVMVWFCTRTFRGESEDVAPPRPWWRMTERPAAGYVLGALFAAQALSAASAPVLDATPRIAVVVASALIAAAFLNSSARLTRAREA